MADDDKLKRLTSLIAQIRPASSTASSPASPLPEAADEDDEDEAISPSPEKQKADAPQEAKMEGTPVESLFPPNRTPDVVHQPAATDVQDLLGRIYGPGMGSNDLKAALAQRNQNKLGLGLNQAGNIIGAAFANAAAPTIKGTLSPDNIAMKTAAENLNTPVETILTGRKMAMEDVGTAEKAVKLQVEKDKADPNSQVSKAYSAFFAKLGFKMDGLPAAEIEKLLPQVTKDHASELNSLLRHQMFDISQQKYEDKQNQLEAKNKSDLIDAIQRTKSRGATKTAWEMSSRIDAANDLSGRYPDLNNMPPNIAKLYAKEVANIASRGQSTEGGTKAVLNPTMGSRMAELAQAIDGAPVGADLGPMLKELDAYVNTTKRTIHSTIGQSLKDVKLGAKTKDQDFVDQAFQDYEPFMKASVETNKARSGAPKASATSGPKGPSVTQNGHTYNWDPAQGKYL